jgi:tetratricopeptide (TPR) repeat protein
VQEQALAIEYFQKAIDLQKELNQELELADSLNNLASLYYSQGRYEDAEPLYLQALEIIKAQLGENHPDLVSSLNNMAYLYYYQGRYEEAEPLYLQALEIRKAQLGENHPNTQKVRENYQEFLQKVVSENRQGELSAESLAILAGMEE